MAKQAKKKVTKKAKTIKQQKDSNVPIVSARTKQLSKLCDNIDGFMLWSEVPPALICKTRITSLNRALKTGGIPGGMLGVIHGPSQGGKTLLGTEVLYSVWASGGWGLFVDAECRAVDLQWFNAVCGKLDEVLYVKPQTYEECIEKIEEFRKAFRSAKEKGQVPKNSFLGIMVDSVNRLTPSNELKELLSGAVKDRKYPLRALITSNWLDAVIPTLQRDEILVFIQRESVKMDAMPNQKKYTVKGGSASIYDGGYVIRVTPKMKVKAEIEGRSEKTLVGEKHEMEILKNSLGPHLNEIAYFYSSVGATTQSPLGLDVAREVREESLFRNVIKKSGNSYLFNDEVVGKNKGEFLAWLKSISSDGQPNYEMVAEVLDAQFETND